MQLFQESEGVESEYVDDDVQDEGVDELESDEDMEVRPLLPHPNSVQPTHKFISPRLAYPEGQWCSTVTGQARKNTSHR